MVIFQFYTSHTVVESREGKEEDPGFSVKQSIEDVNNQQIAINVKFD